MALTEVTEQGTPLRARETPEELEPKPEPSRVTRVPPRALPLVGNTLLMVGVRARLYWKLLLRMAEVTGGAPAKTSPGAPPVTVTFTVQAELSIVLRAVPTTCSSMAAQEAPEAPAGKLNWKLRKAALGGDSAMLFQPSTVLPELLLTVASRVQLPAAELLASAGDRLLPDQLPPWKSAFFLKAEYQRSWLA